MCSASNCCLRLLEQAPESCCWGMCRSCLLWKCLKIVGSLSLEIETSTSGSAGIQTHGRLSTSSLVMKSSSISLIHLSSASAIQNRFVSALCIPSFDQTCLISGSGDSDLFIWDWRSGKLRGRLAIQEAVESFVVVKLTRRSQLRSSRLASERSPSTALAKDGSDDGSEADSAEPSGQNLLDKPEQAAAREVEAPSHESEGVPVTIAVRKIAGVNCGEQKLLVFSLIGSSA